MAPPTESPERRRDHALRALYNRVQDLERQVEALEEKAVTKLWLYGSALTIACGAFLGVLKFLGEVEDAAQKPVASLSLKVDRFIDAQMAANAAQMATNIKTEAMYLNSIERRPREEVREAVLRNTPPKER